MLTTAKAAAADAKATLGALARRTAAAQNSQVSASSHDSTASAGPLPLPLRLSGETAYATLITWVDRYIAAINNGSTSSIEDVVEVGGPSVDEVMDATQMHEYSASSMLQIIIAALEGADSEGLLNPNYVPGSQEYPSLLHYAIAKRGTVELLRACMLKDAGTGYVFHPYLALPTLLAMPMLLEGRRITVEELCTPEQKACLDGLLAELPEKDSATLSSLNDVNRRLQEPRTYLPLYTCLLYTSPSPRDS